MILNSCYIIMLLLCEHKIVINKNMIASMTELNRISSCMYRKYYERLDFSRRNKAVQKQFRREMRIWEWLRGLKIYS